MTITELILQTELGDFVTTLVVVQSYLGIAEKFGGCDQIGRRVRFDHFRVDIADRIGGNCDHIGSSTEL